VRRREGVLPARKVAQKKGGYRGRKPPVRGAESVIWDETKNKINKKLHHIAFKDAQYIFCDADRLERAEEARVQSMRETGNIDAEDGYTDAVQREPPIEVITVN
jgi:hypothetical protein